MVKLTIMTGTGRGAIVEVVDEVLLGRDSASLRIDDPTVSRRHALVRAIGDQLALEDLGSVNGTRINGTRIGTLTWLRDGDVIEIGGTTLLVNVEQSRESATVATERPARARRPSRSPFPPINDYAFLSDGEANALLASTGNVEWMCVPRPDSPAVFAAMLDRSGGGFRLAPAGVVAPIARRYVPGTMVLETTWQTKTGWLTVTDALMVGPWHHCSWTGPRQRAPTDEAAAHVLLRIARCAYGRVDVVCYCEPVFDYGHAEPTWHVEEREGVRNVAIASNADRDSNRLELHTSMGVGFEGRRAVARRRLEKDQEVFVALSWLDGRAPSSLEQAHRFMDTTAGYWRDWLAGGDFPDHPWSGVLQRSALTLKGLIYRPTGAILAAATTSLPETPTPPGAATRLASKEFASEHQGSSDLATTDNGKRNWDYRYTWIRDAAFTLWSLRSLGFREADDFLAFVVDVCSRTDIQVVYAVDGQTELTETSIPLGGYEGARPVRIGNDAYRQQQHDVWGAVVDAIYLYTDKAARELSEDLWRVVQKQVHLVIGNWHLPDRGIWEVRGEPRHFTLSKVMCWVACDRGARLARSRGEDALADEWYSVAGQISADVLMNGLDQHRRTFTQSYGSTELDASLLLLPLVRFLPRGHEYVRNTVFAIARELTEEGLVLRYRTSGTDDGLGTSEATFAICSFWLASAYTEIGEHLLARQLCEKLLSYASPLDLYAEELEAKTGRHWGNFPQAFTHLALINAVRKIIAVDRGEPPSSGIWTAKLPAFQR